MAEGDDPTLWRVDDALWAERRPLLLVDKPRKKPGRPRHDDRPLLDGLIWLARSGGQWAAQPREFGARSTIRDRFQEWVTHGCFAHAWARLLTVYDDAVGLDGGCEHGLDGFRHIRGVTAKLASSSPL